MLKEEIKREENKIENIRSLDNILKNNIIKKNIDDLKLAKNNLEVFYNKLSEKFNSIKLKSIEEAKEKEKIEKQKAMSQKTLIVNNAQVNNQTNRFSSENRFNREKNFNREIRNDYNNDRYNKDNRFNNRFNNENRGENRFNNGIRPNFQNRYNNDSNGINGQKRDFNSNFSNKFNKGTRPFNPNFKPNGQRPNFDKNKASSVLGKVFDEPIINLKEKERVFKNKKKPADQTQEKKVLNKKAQFKLSLIGDDASDESVKYRRIKTKKTVKEQEHFVSTIESAVMDTEQITVKDLSEKIGKPVAEIVKKLFILGIMSTINSSIDFDTASLVASEFNITLEYKKPESFEEKLAKQAKTDDEENLVKRAPVVTVMGHVDHGKTSLLDAIRKTNVISGEAGGITQHIGAYTVKVNEQMITFIDTPGHAAFASMRERGANITDVAILVVAADDGIMPQTLESIRYIKNAGIPMIVAINKIDKPTANIDKVKQQLADNDVLSEEWGGDTIMVPISAKGNQNIDKLLEMVLLQADVLDLKANPNREATGTVIEAKLDKGKGPMATVLVQNGTLKVGDTVVCGLAVGRIRAMLDEKGKNIKTAGPSVPVSILGLDEVPEAGDHAYVVDEKLSKQVIEERKTKLQRARVTNANGVSAEDLFKNAEDNMKKHLNVIVKADVQGSSEALKESILEIQSEEVKVNVISCGVGFITENDIDLAKTTNSIIICFNSKADAKAKNLIEREKIEVYYSRIIYDVIDYLTAKMKSMYAPKFNEVYTGKAEVRMVYKITGTGMVAGSYVLDGKISRNNICKVIRNNKEIGKYKLDSLKIKKDDVKEVGNGFECGIRLEGFEDLQVGDILEAYNLEKVVF